MDKWMMAFWMLVNCKNGISSVEIHKTVGVTQKSAWFMLQRLRAALSNHSFGFTRKMGGPGTELEADETFIGGLTKNMHKDRKARLSSRVECTAERLPSKESMIAKLDRSVRTLSLMSSERLCRMPFSAMCKYGSTIYTDDAVGYDLLAIAFRA